MPWFVLLLLGSLAWAQLPQLPSPNAQSDWITLRTPHFAVHVPSHLQAVGQEVGLAAEQAYDLLLPLFEQPLEGWSIVVADGPDLANGFADPLGQRIVIYTSHFRLSDQFNARLGWWRMVVFHELVHAFDLHQAQGIFLWLRSLLGPWVAPTAVKPYSFLEGMAVQTKQQWLGQSRINDSRTRMMLRLMVKSQQFPTLEQASRLYSRRDWPSDGWLVYNFGGWFLDYLQQIYGKTFLSRLTAAKARGASDHEALLDITARLPEQLYQDFLGWLMAQYQEEIEHLGSRPFTTTNQLTSRGHLTRQPALSGQGSLAYSHSSPQLAGLYLLHNGVDRELLPGEVQFPSFSPNGKQIIFSRTVGSQRDLYRIDLTTLQLERLTQGERAYLAHYGANGWIYYARNRPDGNSLLMARSPQGETQLLADLAPRTLHSLTSSPNSQTLALVLAEENGFQDIYLYHLASGRLERLTQDAYQDADPVFTPDGRTLLFSSDPQAVYNLYALDLEDRAFWQVTHLLGGAFSPTVGQDRIVFCGYTEAGYDLFELPLHRSQWQRIARPIEALPPAQPQANYPAELYQAQAWPPQLRLPQPLQGGLGLYFEGRDPVEVHRYNGLLGWDFLQSAPVYQLSYQNRQWPGQPTLSLQGTAQQHQQSISLDLSANLPGSLNLNYLRQSDTGVSHTLSLPLSASRAGGSQDVRWQHRLSLTPQLVWEEQERAAQYGLLGQYNASYSWGYRNRVSLQTAAAYGTEPLFRLGRGALGLPSYPGLSLPTRQAALALLQLEFPLSRIEQGWPGLIFIDDIWGGVFAEVGIAQGQLYPGAGAFLAASVAANYLPPVGIAFGLTHGAQIGYFVRLNWPLLAQ